MGDGIFFLVLGGGGFGARAELDGEKFFLVASPKKSKENAFANER